MTDETVTETPINSAADPRLFVSEIVGGALVQAPRYSSFKDASNWAAVIALDSNASDGINRRFCSKPRGFTYMAASLQPGCAVEFAADHKYRSGVTKFRSRWYGVVLERTPTHITMRQYLNASSALQAAADMRLKPPPETTPTPWLVIPSPDGTWLITNMAGAGIAKVNRQEDADRIVAAVNG
jgi:hypothetical protein